VPVEKTESAPLTGGTINGTGTMIMVVVAVGPDTVLSRIVKMVGEAQRTRAPVQRLADKVSEWFVQADGPGRMDLRIRCRRGGQRG
jgi:Cu+-exporting ATPase